MTKRIEMKQAKDILADIIARDADALREEGRQQVRDAQASPELDAKLYGNHLRWGLRQILLIAEHRREAYIVVDPHNGGISCALIGLTPTQLDGLRVLLEPYLKVAPREMANA